MWNRRIQFKDINAHGASERANGGANGSLLYASTLYSFYPPRAAAIADALTAVAAEIAVLSIAVMLLLHIAAVLLPQLIEACSALLHVYKYSYESEQNHRQEKKSMKRGHVISVSTLSDYVHSHASFAQFVLRISQFN